MRYLIMLSVFLFSKRVELKKKSTVLAMMVGTLFLLVLMGQTDAFATVYYFQGFEHDTGNWMAYDVITRVPSGNGVLMVPSSSGIYHAEIGNLDNLYQPLFGEAGYSFYGGSDTVYHGNFYQSIDIYIDVHSALPTPYPSLDAFWIDMTPYHADPDNYGAEHNFRIRALCGSVEVYVDGQVTPIATLTRSGWYTFLMTWEKADNDTDPVITNIDVYDSDHNPLGTTQVLATSPGGPFLSSDLRGNGYVWITVWQNGFAGDVLAIDNQRTGLLPELWVATSKDQCLNYGWQLFVREDNAPFKNEGDCFQYVNTGK